MSDGWLQRTKDGTVWRVESIDVYAKCLKEGFTPCEPPSPPEVPTSAAESEQPAQNDREHPRVRQLRTR